MTSFLLRIRRRLTAPTFTSRRDFAGSIVLVCNQTAEHYSLLPAGGRGFLVAGQGGRFLGRADGYTDAAAIVEADARAAIRALPIAA